MTKTVAEKMKEAIDPYAYKVGMVAYTWNRLTETLALVFAFVTKMQFEMAQEIWYTFDNDRSQIKMLQAAIRTAPDDLSANFPQARADLAWMAERAFNLVDARNNVIHAPCIVELEGEAASAVSDPLSGHERAKRMRGKSLEEEAEYCISRCGALEDFAQAIFMALKAAQTAWPGRPALRGRMSQNNS
jgi:hypothetical protein